MAPPTLDLGLSLTPSMLTDDFEVQWIPLARCAVLMSLAWVRCIDYSGHYLHGSHTMGKDEAKQAKLNLEKNASLDRWNVVRAPCLRQMC
ncbi:hypothetical protein NDU88_001725 [Pleurodeles waltl]|uniref:Uncharacterized protein n=1 Tax=Pleurodeles waltl TaxID=8319 RepID=A0AAV7LBU8_PLEWA|nr:hypothetical protein NDU88_001725 [Pleurodeles waltl]